MQFKCSQHAACPILVDGDSGAAVSARGERPLLRVIHRNESCLVAPLAS